MPGKPTIPALRGFNVRGLNGVPTVRQYAVDLATLLAIRRGDPVKEVAGGVIQRAGPADTVLLGMALEPSDPSIYVAREIPVAPAIVDEAGHTLIRVAVADGNNVFQGAVSGVTAQSIATKRCDLVAAILSPTPTVTPGGTTGATTLFYFVVAVDAFGNKAAVGSSGTTTTANAAQTVGNYNDIAYPAVAGTEYYEIWKATSNSAAAGVQIGTSTGLTFRDIGQASISAAGTISTVNNTGILINPAATATNVIQIQDVIRRIDMPLGTLNGLVEFSIPASVSQYLGATGS